MTIGFLLMLNIGCSSSSAPANNYPLLLSVDSEASVNNSAIFYFRVTENGAPIASAKLRRTDLPSDQTFDLGIKSDSGGHFPVVTVVLSPDTLTAVAYQAVRDTLTSNYIQWP